MGTTTVAATNKMDVPGGELSEERIAQIRTFSRAVGIVLILFMCLATFIHSRGQAEWVLRRTWVGGTGLILIVLGMIAPALLDWPEKQWMKLAHFLGYWNTRILLTLIFYVGVVPLGFLARLAGWDDLKLHKPKGDSYYDEPPEHLKNGKHFEHPF